MEDDEEDTGFPLFLLEREDLSEDLAEHPVPDQVASSWSTAAWSIRWRLAGDLGHPVYGGRWWGQEMNYHSSDLRGERPLSLAWKRVVGMPIPARAGGSRATCLAWRGLCLLGEDYRSFSVAQVHMAFPFLLEKPPACS